MKTRKELAAYYGVSVNIITNWLKEIKGLDIKPYQKVLTPKQVKIVIEYIGIP